MLAEKDFAGRQTKGMRERQEDAYAFSDIVGKGGRIDGLLGVVADGMGGHTSGERASELALETCISAFHRAKGKMRERFAAAADAANEAIAKELERRPELEGMGTTLLAFAVTGAGLEWISIGDSPLYLWREAKLGRLNEDHSFRPVLHEMLESGELTPASAAKHPLRNLLRAALTGTEVEMIDKPKEPVRIEEGDVVLAASDGIQTLKDEEIAAVLGGLAGADASALASALLRAVLEAKNPKQDNTTVAVIKAVRGGFVAHEVPPQSETKKDTETILMNPAQIRGGFASNQVGSQLKKEEKS